MEPHFRSTKSGLNRLSCIRQKQPFKPQLGVSKIQYEADPAHQWKCPEKFKQWPWRWNDARVKEVTAMRNKVAVKFAEYLVHTLIVNLSLAIGQAEEYMEDDLPLLFTVDSTRLRTQYTEKHPHLTGLVEKVQKKVTSVVKLVKEAGEVPKCKPRKKS